MSLRIMIQKNLRSDIASLKLIEKGALISTVFFFLFNRLNVRNTIDWDNNQTDNAARKIYYSKLPIFQQLFRFSSSDQTNRVPVALSLYLPDQ